MNLVFIHPSEKVKRDIDGNLYTDGSYSEDIWNMYLSVFSHITLLMRDDKQIFEKEIAQKRFNLIPRKSIEFVPLHDLSSSLKNYLSLSLRKVNNHIIRTEINKADSVIVRIPGNYYAIHYAVSQNKPCLTEVVGCPFDSLWHHSFKGKILALSSYFKMCRAVERSTNLIYVTQKYLQQRYPSKGLSIGCSDVRLQISNNSILELRALKIRQNQENKKIIIGTASGIGVKYKGQQFIIKALSRLKKQGVNCFEYQIAGAGDTSYLERVVKKYKLQESVNFVGSIPHDKIFDWFNSLDIYVQPSLVEGLPRALVEAMSCALPCMGTNVGGIPELLDYDVLFNKGSVEDIVKILLKMKDTEFRLEQSVICYKRSLDYSIQKLESKRIDFMNKVFKSNQNERQENN